MPPPPVLASPPATEPLPPAKDTPWWGVVLVAFFVSLISVIATLYLTRPIDIAKPAGFGTLLNDSITFLPHILILFGVFADIFTMQGAYSIPSLVGICSIPINFLMGKLLLGLTAMFADIISLAQTRMKGPALQAWWNFRPPAAAAPAAAAPAAAAGTGAGRSGGLRGGGAMSAWDGCEIAGFEFFKSEYAPQGLVVTATIFWYYILDLMINRNPLDSVLSWLAFILFFGLQAMQLKDCDNMGGSFLIKTFISFVEGFIIGGVGYGIVQSTIPTRLPSAILPQGPNVTSLKKQADGTYKDDAGNEYIVGPDGRPILKSFIESAMSEPSV
jgi:hypothetical protein